MSRLPKQYRRRGAAAVLAMLFLVLFTTLCVAMFSMATTNVQTARNLSDVSRAQSVAESGLRWMAYRFVKMNRPKTTIGNITASVADTLWPELQTSISADFAAMLTAGERTVATTSTSLSSSPIAIDNSGATFQLDIRQHPVGGSGLDQRWLRVTSTGRYRGTERSVSMDFRIDKKVRFAIVGKVPIQIGRNTLVEGPVASTSAASSSRDPLFVLSDFMHFDTTLRTQIESFNQFLRANHAGLDNRINVNDQQEYNAAYNAGYRDTNDDGYIDEYDLFLARFDSNGDKAITHAEFTDPATGQLFDANLFAAIDLMGGPLFAGDPERLGYNDGVISNADGYAKIRGNIRLTASESSWSTALAGKGKTVNDMISGPITPTDPNQPAVKFSATANDIFDLSPANFEQAAANFETRTGANAGPANRTPTLVENTVLTVSDANGGLVSERTPFGSVSYQATYERPVFRNMTLRNVKIPKGLNALFEDCTFEGVTFVETERDITRSTGAVTTSPSDGMTWAKVMYSGSFSKTTALRPDNSQGAAQGNNLRFHNCTFNGPLAGNYATAYTHFANSWEFTGATRFDNQVDETATIVSPQVNIEMGSFTNPTAAPSTLIGVVVAGNIDIRGTSVVDGSIIVTGDGAGNTTLAYFGASDSTTDPGAMPEGGYGRLNIRYNPYRALPDGINVAIEVLPDIDTYLEGR